MCWQLISVKNGVILTNDLLSWTLSGGLMRLSSVRGPYSDCGDENPGIKQENIHNCSLLQLFWSACSHKRKRRTPSRRILKEKTEQVNLSQNTQKHFHLSWIQKKGGGRKDDSIQTLWPPAISRTKLAHLLFLLKCKDNPSLLFASQNLFHRVFSERRGRKPTSVQFICLTPAVQDTMCIFQKMQRSS